MRGPASHPTLRISFKRILATPDDTSSWWSNARVRRVVRLADSLLRRTAGVRLSVVEIANVLNPNSPYDWHDVYTSTVHDLERAARLGQPDVSWRTDAVNAFLV